MHELPILHIQNAQENIENTLYYILFTQKQEQRGNGCKEWPQPEKLVEIKLL